MPGGDNNMPQSTEERKEKKRLAERRRMENIRKDPEKYAKWKLQMKEKYLKKKREGKIVSVQNLTPKEQKIARKKSRESTRRWLAKKKLREREEDEILDECNPVDSTEINDPLDLKSPGISIIPRSPEIPSTPQATTRSSPLSSRITRSTIRQRKILRIGGTLIENATNGSSNADVIARIKRSPSYNSWISESPRTPSPPSSISSSLGSVVSPKKPLNKHKKAARETTVKNKSSCKHILRKFQYRYKKELKLKDLKILELKRVNEKYRKIIKRLQKDKRLSDVLKRHKENLSESF